MISHHNVSFSTKGFNDIIDVTPQLRQLLTESGKQLGHMIVFVPGSTAGLTTIEYEPGLLQDLPNMLEQIAPMKGEYHHDATWHDGNGYAHLRAALFGPSITVPFVDGRFLLGTWQQVVFIDFDNRSRKRILHIQIYGE
jgi:secondary thiamine-phosphate synthase enzyme